VVVGTDGRLQHGKLADPPRLTRRGGIAIEYDEVRTIDKVRAAASEKRHAIARRAVAVQLERGVRDLVGTAGSRVDLRYVGPRNGHVGRLQRTVQREAERAGRRRWTHSPHEAVLRQPLHRIRPALDLHQVVDGDVARHGGDVDRRRAGARGGGKRKHVRGGGQHAHDFVDVVGRRHRRRERGMRSRQRKAEREMGRRADRAGVDVLVLGVAPPADADVIARVQRSGPRQHGIDVHHVQRSGRGGAGRFRRGPQQPRRRRRCGSAAIVQLEERAARARRFDARDVDALAAVGEEPLDRVRQETVQLRRRAGGDIRQRVEPAPEPALVLAVAGHEDRHVDRSALRDAQHAGRAGRYAFDRLRAGVDLFDVDIGRQILGHH
jgi:hypothetical protein